MVLRRSMLRPWGNGFRDAEGWHANNTRTLADRCFVRFGPNASDIVLTSQGARWAPLPSTQVSVAEAVR
jgi:hypothetical protein